MTRRETTMLSPLETAPSARQEESERRALAALAPRRHIRPLFLLLFAALGVMTLLDIGMGESEVAKIVTPGIVLRVIGSHLPGLSASVTPLPEDMRYIDALVWEQRVPRALSAALIGMLLAMAGVAFQSLLMNPLADPYMVGVSAGSAFGSVLVILLGGTGLLFGFAQPLAAFGTGLLAMVVVTLLARVNGRLSVQTFLLAGIVVGTLLWSLIPLMLSLSQRTGSAERQSLILAQLLGNLRIIGWNHVGMLLPFGVVGGVALWLTNRELNLMTFGEESAAHLGVDTERFKRRVIVAGSLVTAATVAVAGIIAFVGLVVPHIARRIVGPDHRVLLPASMLIGGLLLVTADWLSRVFLGQLEVGVITSLFGAPVFCYLLRRRMTVQG